MEMVKTTIKGINPDTKEVQENNFESEAVCSVFVTDRNEGKVEVQQAIIGAMNLQTTRAMIKALMDACHEVLKNADPAIASIIILEELMERTGKGDSDVDRTSSEPERPAEQ